MTNKKVIIILILIISFILCSRNVIANQYGSDQIHGDIAQNENIILFIVDSDSSDPTLSYGCFVTGSFSLLYYENNILYSQSIEWFIYDYGSNTVLLTGDNVNDNPWSRCNQAYIYKLLEYNSALDMYKDGFVNSVYQAFINYDYRGYGSLPYIDSDDLDFYDIISDHPRNYNNSGSIYNGNIVSINRNSNYDYFFYNLSTNFALNEHGSCGFVAIASLLTYYDFFYNDNFINDVATYQNIHCNNEAFINYSNDDVFSTEDFDNSPGCNDSLQYYLIDIIALNHLNMVFSVQNGYPIYETSNTSRISIIENYIDTTTSISYNDYLVNELDDELEIKNELDNGRPVIMGIASFIYEASDSFYVRINQPHAVVVYGYKVLSSGETIYRCHMGWFDDEEEKKYTDVLIKPLNNVISGLSIAYNGNTNNCNDNVYKYNHDENCNGFYLCHKHSGYVYYLDRTMVCSSYDNYFCPTCNSFIMQGAHIHNKTNIWHNYYNHSTTCPCGYSSYEGHIITGNPLPNGYYICIECGGYARMGIVPNSNDQFTDDSSMNETIE